MKFYFFCLCASVCLLLGDYNYSDKVEKLTNELLSKTSCEISEKYGLELAGFGGGTIYGVAELSLDFNSNENLTVNQARKKIVGCAEIFLRNINSNRDLRPMLIKYPFSSSRISLSIGVCYGMLDSQRVPGVLMTCSLYKGIVTYRTIKEKTPFISIDKKAVMLKETYEEAKRIVEYGS